MLQEAPEHTDDQTVPKKQILLYLLKEDNYVIPFYVGVLIAIQILILTLKYQYSVQFPLSGALSFIPSHYLFTNLLMLLFASEARVVNEGLRKASGKMEHGTYETLIPPDLKQIEAGKNRIFVYKFLPFWGIIWLQIMREDLTRYDISVWAVSGPLMLLVMWYAQEGFSKRSMWINDSRAAILENLLETT